MAESIPPLTAVAALAGPPVPPIKRVRMMNDKEFERLVEAWAETLKPKYADVTHFGGAGDKGVDVAGFETAKGFHGPWDGFQCKYYDHPLYPTDVYHDIGKVIWHVSTGELTMPQAYKFLAPQDIGTGLSQLLKDAPKLKSKLFEHWDSNVAGTISDGLTIALEGAVLAKAESFDYGIFGHKKIADVLNELRGTAYFLETFGGGLPARKAAVAVPDQVQAHELNYVEKLRRAYEVHEGSTIIDVSALAGHQRYQRHFEQQRRAFYHAESLREFSKETVPAGTFEALQSDVLDGVSPVADGDHDTPFVRLLEVIKQASLLPLANNPLTQVVSNADKHGICQQLANDDRLHWEDPNG